MSSDSYFGYDYWASHPDHPLADWKYEVDNGDTRLGYWEWVAARLGIEQSNPESH